MYIRIIAYMKNANVYISGVVGKDTTLLDVIRQVESQKEASTYNVYISSPGGLVDEGFSIYDYLKSLPQSIHTYARGNCDSIATVIFQAGQKRYVEEGINSFVIHNAHINPAMLGASVDANALKAIESELRKQEDRITEFYAQTTKLSFSTLDSLMDKESNLEAKDVVTLGFADETFSDIKAAALVYKAESYNDYPKSATENAKRALKWLEENDNPNDCLTAVGFARANQLAKRERLTRDTIARMAAFKRQQQHNDVSYEDGCGGVAWDAWGGTEGIEWAKRKIEQIDSNNNKNENKMAEANILGKMWDKLLRKTTKNIFFLKLADGQELYVDSEDGDFIDKMVYIVKNGEITTDPAPDGTHELATGKSIIVQDGRILELISGDVEDEYKEDEKNMEDEKKGANMTPKEMEEKMQAMIEAGMKELENKLTQMMTKQSEDLAEARKVELDDEYKELKVMMRNVVSQFDIPASASNHRDTSVKDETLTNPTSANIRKLREERKARAAAKA